MKIYWLFYKFIGIFLPGYRHYRYYSYGYSANRCGDLIKINYKGQEIHCKSLERKNCSDEYINIICSGPSLNKIKHKDKLFNSCILCMNGSHNICLSDYNLINYYVVSDVGFILRNWESFCLGVKKSENLLFDHRILKEVIDIDPTVLIGKNIYIFNLMTRPYRKHTNYSSKIRYFSIEPELGFNPSKTVSYLSLQIAVSLGYRKIIFFGLDLGGDKRFYVESVCEKSMLDKDYSEIESDFEFAAAYCDEQGILVVNASPESKLPDRIFQKIDPDIILSKD